MNIVCVRVSELHDVYLCCPCYMRLSLVIELFFCQAITFSINKCWVFFFSFSFCGVFATCGSINVHLMFRCVSGIQNEWYASDFSWIYNITCRLWNSAFGVVFVDLALLFHCHLFWTLSYGTHFHRLLLYIFNDCVCVCTGSQMAGWIKRA